MINDEEWIIRRRDSGEMVVSVNAGPILDHNKRIAAVLFLSVIFLRGRGLSRRYVSVRRSWQPPMPV